MPSDAAMSIQLPPECETALLERFLKAEAMALWAVRSARLQDVPPNVYAFLRKHEEDEEQHLAQFETMIGRQPRERERLPNRAETMVPRWPSSSMGMSHWDSNSQRCSLHYDRIWPRSVRTNLFMWNSLSSEIRRILRSETGARPNRFRSPRLRGGGNCREHWALAISNGRRSIRIRTVLAEQDSLCDRTALHRNGLVIVRTVTFGYIMGGDQGR